MPTPYSSALWDNRTVGLLGGSFNPAHAGHRHLSLLALKHLKLDAVWWLVSPQNPLKPKKGMAPLEARVKSAEDAARHPQIFVTDIESKIGTRYTLDMLKKLKVLYPRTRFVWLMGSDNLHQIHLWRRWKQIFAEVPVAAIARPPRESMTRSCPALERYRAHVVSPALLAAHKPPALALLRTPLNALSSTEIRNKTASKRKKK